MSCLSNAECLDTGRQSMRAPTTCIHIVTVATATSISQRNRTTLHRIAISEPTGNQFYFISFILLLRLLLFLAISSARLLLLPRLRQLRHNFQFNNGIQFARCAVYHKREILIEFMDFTLAQLQRRRGGAATTVVENYYRNENPIKQIDIDVH